MIDTLAARCKELGIPIDQAGFDDYLADESRFRGHASALIRARSEDHVVQALRLAHEEDVPLTVVSGKTSLTGGPVPLGGLLLDVRGLDRLDPEHPHTAGPGVILRSYKQWVESRGFFYPPDPTSEASCTLGGNVACNASGSLSYLYGPTRQYVFGLRIALPGGTVLDVHRGQVMSHDGEFHVPSECLSPPVDGGIVIPAPKIRSPRWEVCKNAAGLYSTDPMDLVDLFVGSEGILGVFLEITTSLLERRKKTFALMLYLPAKKWVVELVHLLDGLKRLFRDGDGTARTAVSDALRRWLCSSEPVNPDRFRLIAPSCMEWIGSALWPFISPERAVHIKGAYGALYVEQEYEDTQDPLDVADQWAQLVEGFNNAWQGEVPAISTEVALDEKQIRGLRKDRESVPENLNASIRPGLVKIGTDLAVPKARLGDLIDLYERFLPKGKSYIWGHIGNSHIHSNILAENAEEAAQYRSITKELAAEVCKMGGSVSGEHGIGKLKHDLLEMMIGREGIEEIVWVKKALDPRWILNRHTMIRMPEEFGE